MMKRQKISDNNTDRLSDLPNNILVHILEFLDIKQSVQTCVLSKSWKDLWKNLNNLAFNHLGDNIDIFNKFVSHILSGRDSSLPLHSLEYVNGLRYKDCPKTTILEVVKYAASHNVQQLTFHVYNWLIKELELPHSIFHCQSLTSLKLNFFCPHAHARTRKIMFPKSLNLPALKTLHLTFLTFTTNDNGYAEPFSTCNMLSTLVITCCYLQDDTQALSIFNSNVSSLTIGSSCACKEAHNYKVVFSTPKLTSLTLIGHPTFPAPSACNLPFLEEGYIDYNVFDRPYEGLLLIGFLQSLANVKIMTLSFRTLVQINRILENNGSMSTQLPCFVRLKSVKVELFSYLRNSSEILGIREMVTYLLQNSLHDKVDILLGNYTNDHWYL